MKNYKTLEFDEILKQLADKAQSNIVKARYLVLGPSLKRGRIKALVISQGSLD